MLAWRFVLPAQAFSHEQLNVVPLASWCSQPRGEGRLSEAFEADGLECGYCPVVLGQRLDMTSCDPQLLQLAKPQPQERSANPSPSDGREQVDMEVGGPPLVPDRSREPLSAEAGKGHIGERTPHKSSGGRSKGDPPGPKKPSEDGSLAPGAPRVHTTEKISLHNSASFGDKSRLRLGVGVVGGEEIGVAFGITPLPLGVAHVTGDKADTAD